MRPDSQTGDFFELDQPIKVESVTPGPPGSGQEYCGEKIVDIKSERDDLKVCEVHECLYDRSRSFFDNLSTVQGSKEPGGNKPMWRKQRQLNAETFGVSAVYGRRGGGYRSRNGPNRYYRR